MSLRDSPPIGPRGWYGWRVAPWSVGERDFRRLRVGDAVSQLGTQVSVLAIPLIAADTLHVTAWGMALLTAVPGAAFPVWAAAET